MTDASGFVASDGERPATGVKNKPYHPAFYLAGDFLAVPCAEVKPPGWCQLNTCFVVGLQRQEADVPDRDAVLNHALTRQEETVRKATLTGFASPIGSDTGPEWHQAVFDEHLGCRLLVHCGENAKVGHHEDAVHGELGDAERRVGIDHHDHRLRSPRGM